MNATERYLTGLVDIEQRRGAAHERIANALEYFANKSIEGDTTVPSPTAQTQAEAVLNCPLCEFLADDAEEQTIRGYLKALLFKLWQEGEGFNSKRPFGNSGWEGSIYESLARGGVIEGKFEGDELMSISEEQRNRANKLMRIAFDHLFGGTCA